jgi:hypothetical protein
MLEPKPMKNNMNLKSNGNMGAMISIHCYKQKTQNIETPRLKRNAKYCMQLGGWTLELWKTIKQIKNNTNTPSCS